MNRERAIRTIALRDVMKQEDSAYHDRVKMRWYSVKFSTPLHVVETEVPFDDVLRHYWESVFEQMRDSEAPAVVETLRMDILTLSMNEDELIAAQADQDALDADTYQELLDDKAKEEQAPAGPAMLADLPEDVDIEFPIDLEGDAFSMLDK